MTMSLAICWQLGLAISGVTIGWKVYVWYSVGVSTKQIL